MFSQTLTLRLRDTDAAGVVYFAALLALCHDVYEAFWESQGLNLGAFFEETGLALPIVRSEMDYRRPLGWGDRLEIQMTVFNLERQGFQTCYQLFNAEAPLAIVASGALNHVCICPRSRQRRDLPEPWGQVLADCVKT
ncbi:MAG: acyl-CoA thioesterase [Cyanobacteriota bacterium]|jgi:1,4-dihydroxy-2-naphthoyl-CoA hydrolase